MKNVKSFFSILSELKFIYTSKQKKQFIIIMAIIIIQSCLELLSVSSILPFTQAILSPDELRNKPIIFEVCNSLDINGQTELLITIGLGIIIIFIVKNIFVMWGNYIQSDYSSRIQSDLSIRLFKSYFLRPYSELVNINSAEILRGCRDDVSACYVVTSSLLGLITESVTLIMISAYVIYTDWFTAVGALCVFFVVLLGIIFWFKPYMKRLSKKNIIVSTEKNKIVMQASQGAKEILVMQRQDKFGKKYEESVETARHISRLTTFFSSCPDRITEGICVAGIIIVLCIRIIVWNNDIEMFIPKMAAFAMACFKIMPSIGKISTKINEIMFQKMQQHLLYENLKHINEIEKNNLIKTYNSIDEKDKKIAQDICKSDFTVKYDNVSWRYNRNQKPILKNLNLNIKKGDSIGLIGSSGSGKTTTADILLGLLKPQEGKVTINDINIFDMPKVWANIVGYVPQTVYLIDDSIRNNVLFGCENIDDEIIWNSLEKAQIKEFVKSLPEGLETIVGERGVKFSGGQRQRIAIARALINNPQILVLDEATAALDNETERAVMESIEALQGQITLVIVAHRLTTIKKCSHIYEIKNGSAFERKWSEL